MNQTIHDALAGWSNFYLVTGTAAATLTGLQFVVQTLLANDGMRRAGGDDPEAGIAAFGTPTVVHFSVALIVSALMCAPWTEYDSTRAIIGALGIGATIYSLVVLRRTLRQRTYVPALEDWIGHVLLPTGAYLAILVAAWRLANDTPHSLVEMAVATLLLVCIGIHNAWDTVTWLTLEAMRGRAAETPVRPAQLSTRSRKRSKR